MKRFISLLKTNLNVYFGISSLKYRYTKEKKRLWEPISLILGIVIGGGSLIFLYSLLLMGVYKGGQSIGHPEIVLTFAFMASQFFILIFGIFYIMSVFYFSNDMDILIPLPLHPAEVLGVKFITILISEYMIALPMLLPAFIIYGLGSSPGIFYWLKGLVLILMAPILPLVIAAIFVVVLMRFVNIRKSKDLIVVLTSLLGLFMGLGINFFTQNIPEGNEEEFIKNLIESNTGLVESIGNKFPPSIWATLGLSISGWQGWGYFFIFVGLSLILVAVLLWLGNEFFYRGYVSGQEVKRKRKILSKKDMVKGTSKVSPPIMALFCKEWKQFIRTPIYVMNALAGMIMIPFIMIMPFLTQSNEMAEIVNYAKDPQYASIVVLVSLGIMLFGSSMNMISCTALSREGHTFWISKIIPISARDQVLAKLIHSNVLSLIGLIFISIPLYFFLGIALYRLLIMIVIGIFANILINILGLIVDILRPKLEWNDPQEAIKQNLNVLFSMILSLLIMAILGGTSVFLIQSNSPEAWIYLALTLITVILSVPSLWGLFTLADRRYQELEL